MCYCPFSLDQLLFMSRKEPALCVHLGTLVIGYCIPVWGKVSRLTVLAAVLMKLPRSAAHKAQRLLNSLCSPQRPWVSYFAAVWGRVPWLLLSSYQEAQPLLWESKRQCGTSLQKMTDPFVSEISEEDTVVHQACWMLPAEPLGQHRRMTALQSPKPTQGPAPPCHC